MARKEGDVVKVVIKSTEVMLQKDWLPALRLLQIARQGCRLPLVLGQSDGGLLWFD